MLTSAPDLLIAGSGTSIAHPHRIARQVHFIERHPDVGLAGTNVTLIDEVGANIGRIAYPQADIEIR